MSDIILADLFPRRSFVNPDRGHTDRPGRVADGETKIGVVGSLVRAYLHVVHYLGQMANHVGWHVLWRGQPCHLKCDGSGKRLEQYHS